MIARRMKRKRKIASDRYRYIKFINVIWGFQCTGRTI